MAGSELEAAWRRGGVVGAATPAGDARLGGASLLPPPPSQSPSKMLGHALKPLAYLIGSPLRLPRPMALLCARRPDWREEGCPHRRSSAAPTSSAAQGERGPPSRLHSLHGIQHEERDTRSRAPPCRPSLRRTSAGGTVEDAGSSAAPIVVKQKVVVTEDEGTKLRSLPALYKRENKPIISIPQWICEILELPCCRRATNRVSGWLRTTRI